VFHLLLSGDKYTIRSQSFTVESSMKPKLLVQISVSQKQCMSQSRSPTASAAISYKEGENEQLFLNRYTPQANIFQFASVILHALPACWKQGKLDCAWMISITLEQIKTISSTAKLGHSIPYSGLFSLCMTGAEQAGWPRVNFRHGQHFFIFINASRPALPPLPPLQPPIQRVPG
jgi:hypothetical protein